MVKYLDMSNNENKNQINNEDCSCCFNKNTCSKCNYYWKDFDSGKGRVAFSYPAKNIKEGEVVCSMCYLEEEDKEDEDEEDEEEFEYENCSYDKSLTKICVGGGGMMNGNAYAMVEIEYYYVEYGKNPYRKYIGNKIIYDTEDYEYKFKVVEE
jgi:hypothetical protein